MTKPSTPSRPQEVHGKPAERQKWAVEQMLKAAKASKHLGLKAHADLLRRARLAVRLSLAAARAGPDRDGVRRARAALEADPRRLRRRRRATSPTRSIPARTCSTARPSSASSSAVGGHKRCNILYDPSHFVLQQLDYLDFIDIYHERIKAFHVKDAEFNPTGRQGVYSGYAPWVERAGRFRSLGDGQVDFGGDLLQDGAIRLFVAGRCSNGNAASSIPRTARAKARSSSSVTSSASPRRRSTTSPAARSTRRRSGARSDLK